MADKYVPDGSYLTCDKGVTPCTLKITQHANVHFYGQKSATEADKIFPINFTGFGLCSITNSPCAAIPLKWTPVSDGITAGGNAFLLDKSKLLCSFGGKISIHFDIASMLGALQDNAFGIQDDLLKKLPEPLSTIERFRAGVSEGVLQGAESLVEGLWSLGKGVVHVIAHPIDSAKAVGNAAEKAYDWAKENPKDAALLAISPTGFIAKKGYEWASKPENQALMTQKKDEIVKAMQDGSPRDWGRWTGRAAFEIGSMFVGVGEVNAASKAAEAAKLAKLAEEAWLAGKLLEAEQLAQKAKLAEEAAALLKAEEEAKKLEQIGAVVKESPWEIIDKFRKKVGLEELGSKIPKRGDGLETVAFVEINGQKIFGLNSSVISDASKNIGRLMRDKLGLNAGDAQSVFHAEALSLMRAKEKFGTLPKEVTMYVDRATCGICQKNLPAIAKELGVEKLTIINKGASVPIVLPK